MAISVQNLASTGTDAATGNYVGAAIQGVEAFIGLFDGHSNWYKSDQALAAGNWPAVAAFYKRFYSDGSFNANKKSGLQGDLAGIIDSNLVSKSLYAGPRYTIINEVYKKTNDPGVLAIYNQAVTQGLISPDAQITAEQQAAQPAFIQAASGPSGTVGSQSALTQVLDTVAAIANPAAANAVPAAANAVPAAASGAQPAAATTNNTTLYAILAVAAVGVVILIVVLLKK